MAQVSGQEGGEYLRTGDVARLFHVSTGTVDRWASIGRLGCVRTVGGHRRFSAAAVRALIERLSAADRSGAVDE